MNDDAIQSNFEDIFEEVYWEMIDEMPFTDEWYDSGLIDTDGNLLDMTQEEDGDTEDKLYHADLVSDWSDIREMCRQGYIRFNLHMGILEMGRTPSTAQWTKVAEFLKHRDGVPLSILVHGETRELQKDFNSDAPRNLIMNVIKGYYKGKEVEIPDRFLH